MAKDLVEIVPDYDEKVGNMNAKVLAARDAESAGYAHYMAKMLAATDAQREENKKIQAIRAKRAGLTLEEYQKQQQASTQAILARPKEDDEKHFFRPLPKEVVEQSARMSQALSQFLEEHKSLPQAALQELECPGMAEAVGEREVSDSEKSHVEAIRRRPKNTQGQSEKSSVGEEKREAGINAFMCSPGIPTEKLTPEEKQRITQIAPYTPPPSIPPEEKKPKQSDKTFWIYGHFLELKNWIRRK